MKSLLRSPVTVAVLGFLIWAWMALVARTTRWTIEGEADARKVLTTEGQGIVLAGWHESIILMAAGWLRSIRHWPEHRTRTSMMVSLSPDGAAITAAVIRLDLDVVRGSASNKKKADKDKGGLRAIADASRRLKEGGVVCMTPDGPRGPRRIASAGAATLAQRAGARIVPYGVSSRPAGRTGSWDRFLLPAPFGRGAIVFGPPIECPRDMSIDELSARLQTAMEEATRRAETLAGHLPVSRSRQAA
jgi:lysophospholipid acyltransferase (LPLAT)-like uncharacterized protein